MHINDVKKHQADKDHLMRTEGKHPANESKEDFSDLEGLAFQHGADTPRGRQERRQYREGKRIGVGGVVHYE
jgi:hypothetical protein